MVNSNMAQTTQEPNVSVTEEFYGIYSDENGDSFNVKRFTWKNVNRIQVRVINYGARITSICFPDRNGYVDDIVLGFDDLAGYIFYKKHHFGGTIGRMTNAVKDSTVLIGRKKIHVTPNEGEEHQMHGGNIGFDQKIWDSHIEGTKVIMSSISPDGEEGYPGTLMTQITFELSERNEFKIDIEAICTLPTVVNISNLTYFNLAGHQAGPDQLYKHILTLNCNCFTKQDEDNFCTGEIQNVVHTPFDFQIPKPLGKVIGVTPKDGFYQNFCVNKGMNQDDCFVARILHPPSGRMMEIYSNQLGVQLDTANSFGYGLVQSMQEIVAEGKEKTPEVREYTTTTTTPKQKPLDIPQDSVAERRASLNSNNSRRRSINSPPRRQSLTSGTNSGYPASDYRHNYEEVEGEGEERVSFNLIEEIHARIILDLKDDEIIDYAELRSFIQMLKSSTNKIELPFEESLYCDDFNTLVKICTNTKQMGFIHLIRLTIDEYAGEEQYVWLRNVLDTIILFSETLKKEDKIPVVVEKPIPVPPTPPPSLLAAEISRSSKSNTIPPYYIGSERIIGKSRKLYITHAGMALQTQNYPNCANINNFPNCVLKPGEKYRHTITYKFWIRSGNPSRWIKRNMHEMSQTKKSTSPYGDAL